MEKHPQKFERNIGLRKAILLMMGNMVGAGIFIYPALVASTLPHPIWFLLVWVIGGAIALTGALSSAELGTVFPEVGGDYTYLKNAYGKRWAFLYGYLTTFVTFPGSIALGLSLTIYFQGSVLLGEWIRGVAFTLPIFEHSVYYYQLFAIFLLVLLTLINFRGITSSMWAQKIFTLFPLLFLIGIYIIALLIIFWNISTGDASISLKENYAIPYSSPTFFQLSAALVPVYWTFMGWNAPLTLGEEIQNPTRNIPLIMILGPLVVTCIYFLFAFGFTAVIPYSILQNGKDDPYYIMGKYLLSKIVTSNSSLVESIPGIVSFLIFFLVLGNTNSTMITGSRISVAIARDDLFIKKIGYIDPQSKTPIRSLIIQSGIASGMMLVINQESNLLNFSFIAITFLSILTIFSVFLLRKKGIQKELLFKAFGYPFTPILYITFSGIVLVLVVGKYIIEKEYSTVISSILSILLGLFVFEVWKNRSK